MEFKTDAQKACYEKVAGLMKELFGEFAQYREDVPAIGLIMGSAQVEAVIFPSGDSESMVVVRSYVVSGAELRPDLFEYLLRENSRLIFGAFGIDSDNDIVFEHSLLGETCDKTQLKRTVMAVIATADGEDDGIVARWGGQRATDRMRR